VAQVLGVLDGVPWLEGADDALLRYVTRLTLAPRRVRREHVEALMAGGFDDAGVVDVVQVVACFAYMNRQADGLGVGVAESHLPTATELFDQEQIDAHRSWAE
jgi:alkylhydroperoxidase family enzyme